MQANEGIYKNRKRMVADNFLGGIFWGLGATIGASIILTLMGFILSGINVIPVVGKFVSEVTTFVLQKNPNLIK